MHAVRGRRVTAAPYRSTPVATMLPHLAVPPLTRRSSRRLPVRPGPFLCGAIAVCDRAVCVTVVCRYNIYGTLIADGQQTLKRQPCVGPRA